MAAYVIVEGKGEVDAVVWLLTNLAHDCGLGLPHFGTPIRGVGIHQPAELRRQAERVRAKSNAEALLVLRDCDDGCPRDEGPKTAALLADLRLPFPSAAVLAHREYESLFLPCIEQMAGRPFKGAGGQSRPGLRADARFKGDFESMRGVKEWLSEHMSGNEHMRHKQRYKPSVDQLVLTRMVDFKVVREKGLAWFGTLERALRFLAENLESPGQTYPPST